MLERDNLQVTGSWFTGILEGEGCFRQDRGEIVITNTDLDIIQACEKFLKDNFIYYSLLKRKPSRFKLCYSINIFNSDRAGMGIFKYCKLLFQLIEPSLECRRDEFERLLGTSETTRGPSDDLDWLAGIYEAEGSFSLVLDSRGQTSICIEIANSNQKIITKIIYILRKHYVHYTIEQRIGKKDYHKLMKHIRIRGLLYSREFLRLMERKWISQRNIKRTNLMLEYIDSRFKMHLRDPLTERHYQIVQTMRELNRKKT